MSGRERDLVLATFEALLALVRVREIETTGGAQLALAVRPRDSRLAARLGAVPEDLLVKAFARSTFQDSLALLAACDEQSRSTILRALGTSPLKAAFEHALRAHA